MARERLLGFANADWITRFPHLVEGIEDELRKVNAASALPRDDVPLQVNASLRDDSDERSTHVGSITQSHTPTHPAHIQLPVISTTQSPATRSLLMESSSQNQDSSQTTADVDMADATGAEHVTADAHTAIGPTTVRL